MNEYKCGSCSILGNKNYNPLWEYKELLNLQRIYYCNLKNVLKARSYRNLILSRIR